RFISVIGPIVVCLALLSALATFLVLVGFTPVSANHYVVISLLGINALAVLLLLGIILREIWPVMQARRRGRAGARLHTRIVGLLSVRDLISNTLVIAEIYVREQIGVLRGDTIAMAITLTQAKPLFDQDKERFRQFFTAQALLRGMRDGMLIRA